MCVCVQVMVDAFKNNQGQLYFKLRKQTFMHWKYPRIKYLLEPIRVIRTFKLILFLNGRKQIYYLYDRDFPRQFSEKYFPQISTSITPISVAMKWS